MPPIDAQLFRETLLAEFRSAWQTLREKHPTELFYCFGLYTTGAAEYVMATASTEEGLSIATEKYLARKGGDQALMRLCLRWSFCDSPLHEEALHLLPRSHALKESVGDPYDEDAVELVFDTAVDVLKQLDSERLFGTDLERARLTLGIWMGDQSNENMIAFVRQLNSPQIADRFAKELDEGYEACVQLL